jgi:hypothetical protein
MVDRRRDRALDALLDLDGQTLFVEETGRYWVRFVVKRCPPSVERPHGLSYSLTLHGPRGERLVGFDNAHAARSSFGPAGKRKRPHDHRHRQGSLKPYEFRDAASLLADFWSEVDAVLDEKGVRS